MLTCVKVKEPALRQIVIDEIKRRDSSATLDPEGNPVLFWIDSEIPYWEIEQIEGVQDAILARNACPCGSGEFKEELVDARGIFCCYYCSKCEKEKRAQYRVEVLENSSYEVDEQIEPEYKDDLI
jgi:hypothetical protein